MERLAALAVGIVLDIVLGDPYRMPHIIRLIGTLIARLEPLLRKLFPANRMGELRAGLALVVVVEGLSVGGIVALLALAYRLSFVLGFLCESFVCYQMLAGRQLAIEAKRVSSALEQDGLEAGRAAVSMIVGRDTAKLDEAGIIRAVIETVAENTSDGVVAPLLFLAVGGVPGGVLYKAANTMDSMVGYRNERYEHFGWAAAHLDDVLNWVPARVTGVLMCLAASLVGLDGRRAWRVFHRDRKRHASPNSAHPEAACAGALGVQLAGPASYFGVMHDKPTIGDDLRPVEREDIDRTIWLMWATALLALIPAFVVGLARVG